MITIGIPLVAAVISLVFAAMMYRRYFVRRGVHLLVWGIGLSFYGLGALCEVLFQVGGWNPWVFRLWYLSGAFLGAAYLGQGTVYLLTKKRWAHWLMAVLVLGSIYVAVRLVLAQPDPALMTSGELSGHALPRNLRLLTIPFNTYGTLGLVGGGLFSTWLFWRKCVLLNRVVGNILIAAGGLLPAFAGVMSRIGIPRALYIGILTGAILMFVGFLQATAPKPMESEPAAAPASN